jgi:hypothetical protein
LIVPDQTYAIEDNLQTTNMRLTKKNYNIFTSFSVEE